MSTFLQTTSKKVSWDSISPSFAVPSSDPTTHHCILSRVSMSMPRTSTTSPASIALAPKYTTLPSRRSQWSRSSADLVQYDLLTFRLYKQCSNRCCWNTSTMGSHDFNPSQISCNCGFCLSSVFMKLNGVSLIWSCSECGLAEIKFTTADDVQHSNWRYHTVRFDTPSYVLKVVHAWHGGMFKACDTIPV